MTTAATLDAGSGMQSMTQEARRRHAVVPTALGDLTVVAEGDALVGVYFPEHRPAPDPGSFGGSADLAVDPLLAAAAEQLIDYALGERTSVELPHAPQGSERARQVWALIAAVPRGATTTYASLGRAVGVGPRAAGQFVARNPLSVVIPCHRVVASDGRLTGYAGGIDRKRLLLELEGALEVGASAVVPTVDRPPGGTDAGPEDAG